MSRVLSGCQIFDDETLPAGWNCLPLGDRINLAYGSGLPEEDREPGSIAVYGSNGVVGSHRRSLVDGPGILVGRKGTVGAVHFATGPFWPIDTVYYVLALASDNLRFLYHLLCYLPLKFLNAATGVPGLSRRDAHALRGVFPPPSEQADIARVLDAVDTAIEHTRTAIDHAQQTTSLLIARPARTRARTKPVERPSPPKALVHSPSRQGSNCWLGCDTRKGCDRPQISRTTLSSCRQRSGWSPRPYRHQDRSSSCRRSSEVPS